MLATSGTRQPASMPFTLHVELSVLGANELRLRARQYGIDVFGLDAEELRAAIIDAKQRDAFRCGLPDEADRH
ncbi:MAG: hypothetical protein OEL20_04745 [Sulfuritalea sp.]|nr:hypothetical protein [Sulfuritalea sp.]